MLRYASFIARDRQAALGHMKRAGGRSTVGTRIIQHPVEAAVGRNQVVFEFVATDRQAQFTSHPVTVQGQ